MKNLLKKFKTSFSENWTKYRRMETINQCGFDPWEYQEKMRYLHERISSLEEEVSELRQDRDELLELHNKFPVQLRKMWSGGEVSSWIREQVHDILSKK